MADFVPVAGAAGDCGTKRRMLGSTGKMAGTAALRRAAGPAARRLPDGPHAALDPGQRPTALRHLPECPAAHQLPRFRLPFADGPARGGPGQMATLPSVPVLRPDQPGADRRLRPGPAELAWRRLRLPLPAFQRTHAGAALQAAAGVRNPVSQTPDDGVCELRQGRNLLRLENRTAPREKRLLVELDDGTRIDACFSEEAPSFQPMCLCTPTAVNGWVYAQKVASRCGPGPSVHTMAR